MKNGHAPPTHRIEKEQSICHLEPTFYNSLVNGLKQTSSLHQQRMARHKKLLQMLSCLSNSVCASRLSNMVNQPITRFLSRLFHGHNKKSHIPPMTMQRSTTDRVNIVRELPCTQLTLRAHVLKDIELWAIRSQEPLNPPSAWRPTNVLLLQFSSEDLVTRT